MILGILQYPDQRLRQLSKPVISFDEDIRKLSEDMFETMDVAGGVGLAAPQVGHFIRMLVMRPVNVDTDATYPPRVLINPELTLSGEDITSSSEGCLSVPLGYRADVKRRSRVLLTAFDLDGNPLEEVFEDYPAIVLQHEVDHLDGKLFIDHISRLRRSLYDSKVKKWLQRQNAE